MHKKRVKSIKAKDAVSELIPYAQFEKLTTDEKLNKIYRAVHVNMRLSLEIRLNLVKMSEGKPLTHDAEKPENPIRGLDQVRVEEKK